MKNYHRNQINTELAGKKEYETPDMQTSKTITQRQHKTSDLECVELDGEFTTLPKPQDRMINDADSSLRDEMTGSQKVSTKN